MTSGSRARWAELLPCSADAPAGVAAAVFLRGLTDDGFIPSGERVAAANALAGTSAPVGRDPDVERRLRDEVDAFAANYWALAPVERRAEWADLSRRGADATRLRELEPGLDVHVPALTDPMAEALAALVRVLFVMTPRARAIRRNTWILEQVVEVGKWRAALAVVQRDAPALTALEPRLRAVLDPGFDLALTSFVDGASASPTERLVTAGETDFVARTREYEDEDDDEYEAAEKAQAKGTLWGLAIALGSIMFCFTLSAISKRPSRESVSVTDTLPPGSVPRSAPVWSGRHEYQPSSTNHRPLWSRAFTPAEVTEFKRYELERNLGGSPKIPLGYDEWCITGRPPGVPDAKPPADRPGDSFDRGQIEMCRAYDEGKTRVKPVLYDRWVAVGKPLAPGTYTLVTPNP